MDMTNSRVSIRVAIVITWAIVAGLYLRYEAYPVWFTRTVSGYRGVLPDDLLTRESWTRVLIDTQPAGFVHTIFTMDDDNPEPILEITTRMQIRVRILQSIQTIQVFSEVQLDQDYQPQRFTLSASAGDFRLRVNGDHIGDRRFHITTVSGESTSTRTITLPPDTVLYSPLYDMAIQQLRPGRSLAIRTLDPLTLQTTTILITAGPRETIMVAGNPVRAMPIQSAWQGLEFRGWVDANGMMLRQETPFGWVMETTTPEMALQAASDTRPAPQLMRGMAGISLLHRLIGATGTPHESLDTNQ